jgi:iron complex outermembrane receptor protein
VPSDKGSSVNLASLNALGGAVSVQTKTKFSHPGHGVSFFGGSFGRRWVDAQSAGYTDRLSYFVTAESAIVD